MPQEGNFARAMWQNLGVWKQIMLRARAVIEVWRNLERVRSGAAGLR
jgi:hypothetical protein